MFDEKTNNPCVTGYFSHQALADNNKLRSFEAVQQQMEAKQVWEVEAIRDRYLEDNDTSSDDEDFEDMKAKARHGYVPIRES